MTSLAQPPAPRERINELVAELYGDPPTPSNLSDASPRWRAGDPKSGAEISSQLRVDTATMILTSIPVDGCWTWPLGSSRLLNGRCVCGFRPAALLPLRVVYRPVCGGEHLPALLPIRPLPAAAWLHRPRVGTHIVLESVITSNTHNSA